MNRVVRFLLAVVVASTLVACGDDEDGSVKGGIGLPASGELAWKFVGRIDQDALKFTAYGFLTRIDGVDDALLFTTSGERNENSAIFSAVFETREASRSKLNNLTVVDVTGTATVYLNERPSRRFGDSASFAQGTPVATADITGQNILSIDPQNRDKAVAAATAEWRQTKAERFRLADRERQLGRVGLTERLTVSGPGVRTDPNAPSAFIEVAGTMTVTGSK